METMKKERTCRVRRILQVGQLDLGHDMTLETERATGFRANPSLAARPLRSEPLARSRHPACRQCSLPSVQLAV